MNPVRLKLMPLDEFGALGLHDKNTYLQKLADDFCSQTRREPINLDRDALSRLRRFYSRRSLADLKLQAEPTTDLDRALRDLGDVLKLSERRADIVGALSSELPPPEHDTLLAENDQLSFFMPSIYDAPLKDDVNLMDVAPFSLGKSKREGVIRYELNDCIITIDGSASAGLATVFDYDIFLHMVTNLAEEARRYKVEQSKGLRTDIPARIYRPNAAHILKFCRRSSGGKQYKDLEAALDRLQGTRIKISNLTNGKRREVSSMALIQTFRVISKTANGNIDQVEIGIPDWVYSGVVRQQGTAQILTLNPDYFLISQGIGRVIYRLARKAAGRSKATYRLTELHRRSGSTQATPQFDHMVRKFVEKARMFPLPEYDLEIVPGRTGDMLTMTFRDKDSPLGSTITGEIAELPLD